MPNLLLVASDGLLTRVGSITSGRQRFTPWRPASGGKPTLEALIRELLAPEPLLDYLRSCVAFEEDERKHRQESGGLSSVPRGVKARTSVLKAMKSRPPQPSPGVPGEGAKGQGGVVWHTQGSGKA